MYKVPGRRRRPGKPTASFFFLSWCPPGHTTTTFRLPAHQSIHSVSTPCTALAVHIYISTYNGKILV
ncbi:hypothetical protein PVAP13_7KG370301 [Panicum virgatum]|uniref:Uncharacterized protein n=1 Tax=Panicum virgatum TaxID=38727 RepID=A0A8T0QRX4_PANVG|nr:hypothetical protein PVAP13_7KG370301 [Panicum virgatum]